MKRAFVVTEKQTKASKGFGFVQFATRADAERAVTTLQAKEIDGRKLKLEMAGKGKGKAKGNAGAAAAAAPKKAEEVCPLWITIKNKSL